jgi:hypothetical protein
MNAEQINALGGWCELVGVWFVARDLMSLARYRDKPKEWAGRLKAWWAKAAAAVTTLWRRLWLWLRRQRPAPSVGASAGAAGATASSGNVTVTTSGMRGPFTPRPGQSLEEQIAELGLLVNRLRQEAISERQERERAIAAEREARRGELRGEAERQERQVADVRQEVEGLREATTGDLGLKAEGVVFLVAGIVFTVWPGKFSDWLPAWPPFPVAVLFVITWPLARLSWALWLRPREEE